MDQQQASEIPEPSPGRIVNFHHNESPDHKEASNNNATIVPAMVTKNIGLRANLTVFPDCMLPINGICIPHESSKEENYPYWSWPERK